MTDWVVSVLADLRDHVLSLGFIYSPVYLLATVALAYLIWRARGRQTGFIRFILPGDVYRHPSTLVDAKVAAFNYVFSATGALAALSLAPAVTYYALAALNGLAGAASPVETTPVRGAIVAVLLFVTQDFCRFLNHYLHHNSRVLWPFHAVHHSAEVLTPITFMRAHPVYHVLQKLLSALLTGLVQALVLFALVGQVEAWVIVASAVAFQVYILLGAHLRHSHIAFSYGRVLEHILISPAQHQIHHSSDPRHFEKNFGEVFAIWDWMFGTLVLADRNQQLVFGIADRDGRLIEQPHPTLRDALLRPFGESARAIAAIACARRPRGEGPGTGAARARNT